MFVQEEVDVIPWFLLISTNNRYWMIQTVERIHEGGFMSKWNDLAFHAEINQNKKKFLEPSHAKAIAIKINELWSVVVLCMLIHFISLLILGLELMVRVCKMSFEERWFCVRRLKAHLKRSRSCFVASILRISKVAGNIFTNLITVVTFNIYILL